MLFTIEKESLLNKLRITEKATQIRGIQPVLSNILIECSEDNSISFSATDLDLTIVTKTIAAVKKEGKITLPAKKLTEIASKLPEKPITFELNEETNVVNISCGNTKFSIIGICASEFPPIYDFKNIDKEDFIEIETKPFIKSIKYTSYSAANYENRNIISGVFCLIEDKKLEMAATDGNRLTKNVEEISNEKGKSSKFTIPSKTLNELLRISSLSSEEKINILQEGPKIIFKTNSYILISRLLEGEYPPYKQLIPQNPEKKAVVEREEFINALEIVSTMVDERESTIKLVFSENKLLLMANTPDSGASEDVINIEYEGEELTIAFNYKYILESLKTMECKKIEIGLSTSLSATIFKPDSENDYLCLIMPKQIR